MLYGCFELGLGLGLGLVLRLRILNGCFNQFTVGFSLVRFGSVRSDSVLN